MKIRLLTVGTRMPAWVQDGIAEYEKRCRHYLGFSIVEIPMPKRSKSNSAEHCIEKEGQAMLSQIPQQDFVVALEVSGTMLDTESLAQRLQTFRLEGNNVSLLVGGPDGLSPACVSRANESWSLSALTLPHPLVRILLTEQLYRASSILQGHPYHRD